jgi:hypothetical protein
LRLEVGSVGNKLEGEGQADQLIIVSILLALLFSLFQATAKTVAANTVKSAAVDVGEP